MQNSGVVLDRFLCSLSGPFHVLHLLVQHLHEDLLHLLDCIHNLFDALQETLLHCKSLEKTLHGITNLDLRCHWRRLPPFHGASASGLRDDTDNQQRVDLLGVHLELQFVVRGNRIHSTDCDAEQDQTNRKHHIALCGDIRAIQVLLYFELGLPLLRR